MKKLTFITFIVLLGIGFVLGDLSWIYAQEEEFTLQEITVTAQKRQENQQKVAIAMEVISNETIKELGRSDINQILSDISNVIVNKSSAGLNISARGINDDKAGLMNGVQPTTPTVAMNTDGVYSSRADSGSNLYDVERVEILFGPQSTMYSSPSPGGIVNIITGSPKLGVIEGSGTFEYGNYSLLHAEGVMNAPLSESTALRAAFNMTARNGYISDGTDDEDSKSGRLKALYKPNDNFSFVATGEIIKNSNRGFSNVKAFKNQSDVANPWITSSTVAPQPYFQSKYKLYGQMDWNVNIGTITVIPARSTRSYTKSGVSMMGANVTTFTTGDSWEKGIEFRMASNADAPFKYIIGYNWYKVYDAAYTTQSDGGWVKMSTGDTNQAVYGNVTYPLTAQFRVNGGMRLTWDKTASLAIGYPDRFNPTSPDPEVDDTHMEYNAPDYKIGIEYDLSDAMMVFADWASSFRIQGMAFRPDGTAFPPEKLKAYSIGLKSRFFENKFQLNGSAYYYDYKNYFAVGGQNTISRWDINGDGDYADFLPDPNTGVMRNETITVSDENAKEVGDATVYGVDISTNTIITAQDKLNVSVSYLYKEFDRLYFNYMDITNSLGVPDLDMSGKPMTFAPKWVASVSYSHNFLLESGGIFTARIDSKYQAQYQLSWNTKTINLTPVTYVPYIVDNTGYIKQEAHMISNISGVYVDPSGQWTLSAYMKNIENYAVKLSGGSRGLMIGSPRTFGAILSVKF